LLPHHSGAVPAPPPISGSKWLYKFPDLSIWSSPNHLQNSVVMGYPIPSEGWWWERGGTPRKSNSLAMPQGLDQSSKMEEVVPKMARWKGSDAGQSRRR